MPYLQRFFKGLGTGGEGWSAVFTQYCDGAGVSVGSTQCPSGSSHIPYPTAGVLAGVWYDSASPAPQAATASQLANEAQRAAAHFGNLSAASNRSSL